MNLEVKPLSFTPSNSPLKSGDGIPDQFPAGLRVLVVDDDRIFLKILEQMLRKCQYEVTICYQAEVALKILRDNKNGFDLVLSDVHMPEMDGLKLLEYVGLEMDLPVIMMSVDDDKNVVMKGVTHGACDYLIKPVRMEALMNIWQHVVRKKKHEWMDKDPEHSGNEQKPSGEVDYSSSGNEGSWKSLKKRKGDEDEDEDEEERDDSSRMKKPRVVWSIDLHQQFVNAVNQIGIDKAVPKKILQLMDVPGLTREKVASHLQKYRLYLRRLSASVSTHPNGPSNPFMVPHDPTFGPISSLDIQALAASRQGNFFTFENNPKLRFIQQQQQNGIGVNLLHGIPTNMTSKQPFTNMNMMVQSRDKTQILNEGQPILSHASQQNGNVCRPAYSNVSQPFVDMSTNWGWKNVGTHDQINSTMVDNSSRMKAERMPDMGFQNGDFHDNLGQQEDLLSAIFKKQQAGVGGPVGNEFVFDGSHIMDDLPV